jgi:hypothetical protein
VGDGPLRRQRVPVDVHRPAKDPLHEFARLRVIEVLLVNVAGVVLQHVVLHRLKIVRRLWAAFIKAAVELVYSLLVIDFGHKDFYFITRGYYRMLLPNI